MTIHAVEGGADRQQRPTDNTARCAFDPLEGLPPVIDLMHAAFLLGVGRTTAYKLVRRGEWPTPLIRVGRSIKVPSAPLRELLTRAPYAP